jgi:NADH-quinone oxidoreductase subunit M
VLSILIFSPTFLALLFCLSRDLRFIKWASAILTCFLCFVSFYIFAFCQIKGFHFRVDEVWIPIAGDFAIKYSLGVDGLSASLVFLTALLTFVCTLCSWHPIKQHVKGFYISLLLLESGMIGVFCALDLVLFYIFWEFMLIPMYFIIGIWGGENRIYAAIKFIIFTMLGSLFMLIAIILIGILCGSFDMLHLRGKVEGVLGMYFGEGSIIAKCLLFGAFALTFAIKVPLVPFHTWLPDAHVEAPTAGSVILAGILLKMGAYGFLRICLPFFPETCRLFQVPIVILALTSIVFGGFMCWMQRDIKKLIAYSSVSHLGFVMLGIFTFTVDGAQGATIQMFNHGLSTGALFLLVGVIYDRTHKRGVYDFGGVFKVAPVYATIFMIVMLSSIGLPGLNNFVGEFLVLVGTFSVNKLWAVVAGFGIILGAIYMLHLYRNTMFGTTPAGSATHLMSDVSDLEFGYFMPILAGIFILGVLPNIFLDITRPVSEGLVLLTQVLVVR